MYGTTLGLDIYYPASLDTQSSCQPSSLKYEISSLNARTGQVAKMQSQPDFNSLIFPRTELGPEFKSQDPGTTKRRVSSTQLPLHLFLIVVFPGSTPLEQHPMSA